MGQPYHDVMLASRPDSLVRERFLTLARAHLHDGASVLDFGAGTGIDASIYAAAGHTTYVYEPSEAQRGYMAWHCRDEIAANAVIPVDSYRDCKVHAVTANFAVLNHFEDHILLFDELAHVVEPGGFVLASMLNPYYLGDARYAWWRANLGNLLRHGRYGIASESRIHRFTPRVVAEAAAPHFRLERLTPRGLGLATNLYMFLLLRRVRA